MHTIRRISLGSAFKFGFMFGALFFAILGLFIVVLPAVIGGGMLRSLLAEQGFGARELFGTGAGIVGGLILYIIGILVNAIGTAIAFAIQALVYNVVAMFSGGIAVELERQ